MKYNSGQAKKYTYCQLNAWYTSPLIRAQSIPQSFPSDHRCYFCSVNCDRQRFLIRFLFAVASVASLCGVFLEPAAGLQLDTEHWWTPAALLSSGRDAQACWLWSLKALSSTFTFTLPSCQDDHRQLHRLFCWLSKLIFCRVHSGHTLHLLELLPSIHCSKDVFQ